MGTGKEKPRIVGRGQAGVRVFLILPLLKKTHLLKIIRANERTRERAR